MKKYIIASTPIMVSILCFITSTLMGSEVLENGMLHEPGFFLIPIGFLFFFIGLIAIVCVAIVSTVRKIKVSHE